VLERELQTVDFIIAGRGAWLQCRSVVVYMVDWARVAQERAAKGTRP
jgi:hypothetical protein